MAWGRTVQQSRSSRAQQQLSSSLDQWGASGMGHAHLVGHHAPSAAGLPQLGALVCLPQVLQACPKCHVPQLGAPCPCAQHHSSRCSRANLSIGQPGVRGRQWLPHPVAAANTSDAFHIDSPISENNFISAESFQNIPNTFQIHSKIRSKNHVDSRNISDCRNIPDSKKCKLRSISDSVALVRFIRPRLRWRGASPEVGTTSCP